MGILDRLRNERQRRRSERNPIPDELWEWAVKEHRIFRGMGPENEVGLRKLSTAFLSLKRFDAVDGAAINDELKVSVAAQACLPLLGLDISWYRDFTTIFITPDSYTVTQSSTDEAGVVHEYEDEFAGEAFALGPVALSVPDIDASGWGDGYNTVIHEMAHKLDGLDGAFDGRPPLHEGMDGSLWKTTFTEAWEDLKAKLDSPGGGSRGRKLGTSKRRTSMDSYAAVSLDEFFAVACEYFWEKPAVLIREYPEVFDQLKLFFRRDPSAWRG
ncbi:MAG: zinc-dependent peptidase [Spirochaetes bacterium]|nr:zinc-dependent peptidase [Spirochaetota bacterium]